MYGVLGLDGSPNVRDAVKLLDVIADVELGLR